MSNPGIQISSDYLETLLSYYEDEISGEAYFYALADHFDERDKIILLARIERDAAQAIEPLLERYGLTPKDEAELKSEGRSYLKLHQSVKLNWVKRSVCWATPFGVFNRSSLYVPSLFSG